MNTQTQNEQFTAIARDILKIKKLSETIFYLFGRWQDEREFENIKDYSTPITPLLPDNVKLVKMISRPFGFKFTIDGMTGIRGKFFLKRKGNYMVQTIRMERV